MNIISLEAENVKRLTAVHIKPDGHLVEITGKNRQGKTSVLDAIWWALAGSSNVQKSPIRKGAEKAIIKLDLGTYKVTRTFRAKDDGDYTTTLTVEGEDEAKFQNPQKILNNLIGELSFDPISFTQMPAKDQFNALKVFVPDVDFEAIEKANDDDFKKRTAVNVEAKALRAQIAGIAVPDELPTPIDESALVAELEAAGEHNAAIERRTFARNAALAAASNSEKAAAEKLDRASRLRAEADALEKEAAALGEEAAAVRASNETVAIAPPIDTSVVRAKIDSARAANAQAAQAKAAIDQRQTLIQKAEKLEADSAALTKARDDRTAKKEEAIAKAKLPVDGISFADGFLELNGVPFDQASDAEQLDASIRIAAAMNPKLRIIRVRDGSKMDEDSMTLLAELASKADMQVWIETVASDRPGAIIMEDGHIKGQQQEAAE